MFMLETWRRKVGERSSFDWHRQDASKKNRKGRAIGNILVEVRKNLEEPKTGGSGKVRMENDVWRLAEIYILLGMERGK